MDTEVRAHGCPGGPDLHLHRGFAVIQAGEALGQDPGDGASLGHVGRVMEREGVHQPRPSDGAEHRVGGQLRLELGAGKGDGAPYPVPRVRRGRVVQEDEAARGELVVLAGAPGGDVRYHQTTVDGRLLDLELGDDPDAEVTLTQTYAVAVDIATGALDANAAFMQGRVKVVGPMGTLMALIPLTQSAEYLALLATLTAQTTY